MNRRMKNRFPNSVLNLMAVFAGLALSARYDRPDPTPTGDGAGGAGGASGGGAGGSGGAPNDKKVDDASARIAQYERQIQEANARVTELSEKLKGTKSLTDEELAEFKTLKEASAKAEEDRKKAQGQFELLLKEATERHSTQLQAVIKERDETKSALHREKIENILAVEIPKHTTAPIAHVRKAIFDGTISIDEKGQFAIKDETGAHPLNAAGKKMSIGEFVQSRIEAEDWLKTFKPTGGSGSKSQEGAGSGEGGDHTPDDISKMTGDEYREYRKKIGIRKAS